MERSELQGQIEHVKQHQQEERKVLAVRIHQMGNSKQDQDREGLSRDFNNTTFCRDKDSNSATCTQKHTREPGTSSHVRIRRFER